MKSVWTRTSEFFEDGDLVPFAVLTSIWHFVQALIAHGEAVPVAIAQGIFVDMLHFRTVRQAVGNHRKGSTWAAVATTAVSYLFHLLFYMKTESGYSFEWVHLLLAAPLPLGIPILAWQQSIKRKQGTNKRWQRRVKAVIRITRKLQAVAIEAQSTAKQMQDELNRLQGASKRAQSEINRLRDERNAQRDIIIAWQHLNTEAQALARFNAKLLTAEQTASIIGVADVRTVKSRADKLNGVS